ncbi:MAG: hypothetical protein BGP12_09695 [Rhodospirillales bacterium 70-18]|nr:hypothetical protein [Rhodospirillales bacterium]OJY71849.1 MAG: hypothetical protein BGP12_09695 [Rhodospirillales bacterium 70-18]
MSISLVRMRFAAVAAKIETTPGTDAIAGTPAAADWLAADCEIDFDPVVVENPELTGTLDKASGIVGGLRPRIRLRVPLRGSGTAGTAPDWGKLMRCCTMLEQVTAAPIGVPTAATAGTATSITLPTPFSPAAQAYRGMPLLLSGDRSITTGIIDYTTGKVASVGDTLSPTAGVVTLAQIPVNVLYAPTSDETLYKTATLYFYADGLSWRFGGAQGTWSLELTSGGIGFLTFDLRAQMLAMTGAPLPTGWNSAIRPTPPRFVNGRCQLNRAVAQCRRLQLDLGVEVILPDNPESLEGYDPAVPISRDGRGNIDPYMNTTNAVALYDAFRAGTPMPLMAVVGVSAGNRFLITAPAARATGFKPGNRDGLGQHDIAFQCDGADSVIFLATF